MRAVFLSLVLTLGAAVLLAACDDGGCPDGQDECGGLCVSFDTDRANCGACGVSCGVAEVCAAGVCRLACPSGLAECDGSCVDTDNDPANCGGCGTACEPGQHCARGACDGTPACPEYLTECEGLCVDTDNDPANCGGCGEPCEAGEACLAGECLTGGCPDYLAECEGTCVDTDNDIDNCGACGTACDRTAADNFCLAGECVIARCHDGWGDCDGEGTTGCETDLMTDDDNCGRCGTVCDEESRCESGFCSFPSFRVTSLSETCTVVDHDATTGDDRGGIASSTDYIVYMGDESGGRFAVADASGQVPWSRHDGIVSDLATGTLYALFAGDDEIEPWMGTFEIDNLRELAPEDGSLTGTRIDLSTTISIDSYSSDRHGVFAGWGMVVLRVDSRLYAIRLPSGAVRDLGAAPTMSPYSCESWAHWGIAENFDGSVHLVYRNGDGWPSADIVRTTLSTGLTTTLAAFSDLSDMCSIGFNTTANRWVFHHEGWSQFGGFSEAVGTCEASWDAP